MKPATKIAVIVLSLVAIAHLLRLLFSVEVTIGGWLAPMWLSVLGTVIPAALVFFIYREH
ncbi:MAG: hypothetical protein ACE5EM_05240 [Sphingomonadales bacterium]